MRKTNKSLHMNKVAKRVVSAVTALVMFSGFLPIEELPHNIRLPKIELTAHAVDDIVNNPKLGSYGALVDYSEAYRQYPNSHHENDEVSIAIATGETTDLMTGFQGIGTAEHPFAGKIIINSSSYANFNIDTAFFDYVYDYVEVVVQNPEKTFTINISDNNTGAVFANHVVHDTRDSVTYDAEVAANDPTKRLVTPASWTVQIEDYQGNSHTHSSLIGEMGENAEATVGLTNNSTSSFSSSSGNVGTICGTMQTGSKLTVKSVTGSNAAAVTAESGNAGGVVGEMLTGSTLTVKGLPSTAAVTASGYAGGLVGVANDATVIFDSSAPSICNTVTGTSGAGGVFGYFKPNMDNSAYSLSLDNFIVGRDASHRCTVSSPVAAGGFFGVLENIGGTITLSGKDNTIYAKGNGDSTIFGGIVGSYKASALTDTLSIEGTASSKLKINTDKSGNLTNYGGAIGKIDGTAFAKIGNVEVNAASANDEFFGGAVGAADTAYVYVNNLNLTATSIHGGSIVGHSESGVIHLSGATDISAVTVDGGVNYGQIVGYRNNALVFADRTWNLTRNSTAVAADDIGSWGEVVRFNTTDFLISSVLSTYYDPTSYPNVHFATLIGATINDAGKIVLSNKVTFATAALNMQLNDGAGNAVLVFDDTTNCAYETLKSKNIVMTGSIDLSLTGMTGLTRDNGSNYQYAGTEFDGTSTANVLTLAIGEGYEGNGSSAASANGKGKIYRHKYNGLFGETTSDFTIKNVTISGCVNTDDRAGETDFYVGTVAGNAAAKFNTDTVIVDSDTKVSYATSHEKNTLYVGGLVGKLTAPGNTIIGTQTGYTGTLNCTFSAIISGSASTGTVYIGGVSGYVGSGGSVKVYDVKITNEVSNSGTLSEQTLGGLFATVDGGSLDLNGVETKGLKVKGKISTGDSVGSMGGLFGYNWDNVTATFNNISVSGCELDNDTSSGNQAAIVYTGSGYWKFSKVEINGLSLTGSAAASFGMLVNKAYSGENAMYLELPKEYTYTINNVSGTAPSIYDELAVYTIMPKNTIEANSNAVISINTKGTTRYGTQSDGTVNMTSGNCNTYQNQVTTTGFSKSNSNSRYYYNVDNYKGEANTGAAALYLWSVYQYADDSIQSYIASTEPSSTFSGDLDLDGYSYYPVDVKGTVDISESVGLYNEEIETIEGNEASGKGDGYSRTTLTSTQHYLMHAGLFRNVSGTVNIKGTLSLSGTVPDTGSYCGALICGTIGGSTQSDAVVSSNHTGASISLAGIKVHNKDANYSPLLINKASGYVVMDIYNVSATSAYNTLTETVPPEEEGGESTERAITDTAATSLIGKVGSDTAELVRVTFKNVKLDARETESTLDDLTDVYGTTKSIFTRATLLESLTYSAGSGSFGVYNYEHDEDWTTSHVGNVTYGIEISSESSVNKGKEYYYYKKFLQAQYFTNPEMDSVTAGRTSVYSFTGYRPYVAVWGTQIGTSSTKHQLDVNHSAATFSGCGTYNDPFVLAYDPEDTTNTDKSGGLVTISKIMAKDVSSLGNAYTISLPDDLTETWCENKNECHVYTFNGSTKFIYTYEEDGETKTKEHSLDEVRKYLAGAYYLLGSNIEIESNSNFQGLGVKNNSDTDDMAIFRGVIVGDGKTITNKTTSPLIRASYGCVVKNLTIKPEPTSSLSVKTDNTFAAIGGANAYGAVIGRVMGGDNIIDQVTVDTSGISVTAGNYRATVGSYVGVVLNGGVFFRNMDKVTKNVLFSGGIYAESDKGHLYCNPYVGRVINGFAVNETTSGYAPYENGTRTFGDKKSVSGSSVSLHNGNKNYSITDISKTESKLSVSGSTIDVPGSQAFFIMSLIINSGMGSSSTPVIGYYSNYQITRHANYDHVGSNIKVSDYKTSDEVTDEEAQAAFKATADYLDYAKTSNDSTTSPYLISDYTTGSNANTLGSGTDFTLNVNDNIVLPDGYKGIGSIFNNSSNLTLALTTFDGKKHTISQNTTFYSYTSSDSNGQHKDNYLPYIDTIHGLGLFNYVNNATYKDCILTGNVVTRQYSGGNALNCITSNDLTALTAGTLVGALNMTTNENAEVTDVYLQNTYTEGMRETAGMIGYLISTNGKEYGISITNTANNSNQSKDIRVSGGTSAAGMIARQGNDVANQSAGTGDISIDLNNHYFDFTSIVSRYNSSFNNSGWNADWAIGVGGLVGVARANNSDSRDSNKVSVENVNIGSATETAERVVSCESVTSSSTQYGVVYTGGLVGVVNRAPVNISNCNIYNLSVKSKNYAGGTVGWAGTASDISLTDSKIINKLNATVYSDESNAGGVIGFCKNENAPTFKVNKSEINGYYINGKYAGCLLGNWESGGAFAVNDSVIKDCRVTYSESGGGIAGQLQKNLYGYNVNISGITFNPKGTAKQGYITGNRSGGIIKIVGFLRSGTISEPILVGSATADTTTGRYKSTDLYGAGGYVIFADFDETLTNQTASTRNHGANDVDGESPYVTINPALTIDDSVGLLTGDGISTSAVTDIREDTSNKKYTVADLSYFEAGQEGAGLISTFSEEWGDVITGKSYDFPLLIINSANTTNTTETAVNNYLRLLTNTDTSMDFSYGGNKAQSSNINNDAKIGTITIKKCTYDKSTGKFVVSTGTSDASLVITSGEFKIRTDNSGKEQYDTAANKGEGQFTLIDVAFKDPSATSKVAYHLYVPVIVKKLVEYKFDISVLSGTTYDRSIYGTETDGVRGRPLLENLGAPVTFEFEYNYLRTADEWTNEDKNYSYPKYLTFSNGGNYNFGSNTKAVLIDMNRGGVAYYLDNWNTGFQNGKLDLQKFSNASGNFSPMTFSEMITSQGITGNECVSEKYYLTIYTTPYSRQANDNSKQVAHYTVASDPFTDTAHPSRRINCESQSSRQPHNSVHLIIGDFYTNTLTVTANTTDRMMSASNKQIEVNLVAGLDVINDETHTAIDDYLIRNDIKIYQSYLVAFEKYLTSGNISETGISAIDECGVVFNIHRGDLPISVANPAVIMSRNHIELQNNIDLSSQLLSGAITIEATATMGFNDEDTRIAQFPKATESDEGIGALVIASSNISSQQDNIAYSPVSRTEKDSANRYYYRTSEQAAYLSYYVDYSGATKDNQRDTQLGINARELESDNKSKSKIYTELRYDASELLNVEDMEYIRCTVKLYQKQSNGEYLAVPINKFLTGLTVNGTETPVFSTYDATNNTFTEFAYVFDVDDVAQFINEENVYKIPIEFEAITGNTTGFKDQESYIYANYKVEVTASAFDDDHSEDEIPWTDYMPYSCPSPPDYVIYTNARIYTELIKTGS